MKMKTVIISITIQGLFLTRSCRSSFTLDFCSGLGMILSFVVRKVIIKNTTPIKIAAKDVTIGTKREPPKNPRTAGN